MDAPREPGALPDVDAFPSLSFVVKDQSEKMVNEDRRSMGKVAIKGNLQGPSCSRFRTH